MPYLVLIRHSQSQPQPEIPARLWSLTEEGRRRCQPLAQQLAPYSPDVILTSTELKAIETGELLAQKLGIPCQKMKNLHEHERETTPFFATQAEFQEAVAALFAQPDKLVLGDETASQAQGRFRDALESALSEYPQENIAIITHGTVLSLFASQYTGQEIFSFWQNLGLPALIAFSYPQMKLLAQVNQIT